MSADTPPAPRPTMTPADVRRIREARGLSQAELAAKLGVRKSYVSHFESGSQIMTLLFEGAMRNIEATGGPALPAVCDGCAGEGVHRHDAPIGCTEPRFTRCDACNGSGVAAGDGRVIV